MDGAVTCAADWLLLLLLGILLFISINSDEGLGEREGAWLIEVVVLVAAGELGLLVAVVGISTAAAALLLLVLVFVFVMMGILLLSPPPPPPLPPPPPPPPPPPREGGLLDPAEAPLIIVVVFYRLVSPLTCYQLSF